MSGGDSSGSTTKGTAPEWLLAGFGAILLVVGAMLLTQSMPASGERVLTAERVRFSDGESEQCLVLPRASGPRKRCTHRVAVDGGARHLLIPSVGFADLGDELDVVDEGGGRGRSVDPASQTLPRVAVWLGGGIIVLAGLSGSWRWSRARGAST